MLLFCSVVRVGVLFLFTGRGAAAQQEGKVFNALNHFSMCLFIRRPVDAT